MLDALRGLRLLGSQTLPEGQRLPGSEILQVGDFQRGGAIGVGAGVATWDGDLGSSASLGVEARKLLLYPNDAVAPLRKQLPVTRQVGEDTEAFL